MWDSTALSPRIWLNPIGLRLRFAESHISRKTSEIWGTQVVVGTWFETGSSVLRTRFETGSSVVRTWF
jgi:hypothetical protein